MEATCFKIVSLGIVAENKVMQNADGSWCKEIHATPIESQSMLDGEIKSNPEAVEVQGVDNSGQNFSSKAIVDSTVVATWLPFGSNRVTAPDVRRGERVYLWQAADDDKYYWTIAGLDGHLRKLETVIFAFSASKDEGSSGLDIDKCYFIEVSTHSKAITLQTSSANGEPFEYTFQFNTAEGAVTLADDVGNYFELDSEAKKLTLKNQDNSHVILDKTKINIKATDEVVIDVGATHVTMTPSGTIWKTPKFDGGS
ncbi:hypothetical protein D3C85_273140 [compost metagenome]